MTARVRIRLTVTRVLLAVAATATVAAAAPAGATGSGGGTALTTERGTVSVQIEPTTGLTDGQEVTVTVITRQGVLLDQVTANQCTEPVNNDYDFSVVGGRCSREPLSPNHDGEKATGKLPPLTSRTSFPYRVGVGHQDLPDVLSGTTRTLTCGPGARPCLIGLWIQETDNPEVFVTMPLYFGADRPGPEAAPGGAEAPRSSTDDASIGKFSTPGLGADPAAPAPPADTGRSPAATGALIGLALAVLLVLGVAGAVVLTRWRRPSPPDPDPVLASIAVAEQPRSTQVRETDAP